jgi:hypothetical protein
MSSMSKVLAEFPSSVSTNLANHTLMVVAEMGIDIVGPLTTTQGNYKFAVVVVEYFTKWVEVKPLVNIAATRLKRFFWQNIICHFGVPTEITVDNAK